jgi:hypothetical protein
MFEVTARVTACTRLLYVAFLTLFLSYSTGHNFIFVPRFFMSLSEYTKSVKLSLQFSCCLQKTVWKGVKRRKLNSLLKHILSVQSPENFQSFLGLHFLSCKIDQYFPTHGIFLN